jgi:hypothetical protein
VRSLVAEDGAVDALLSAVVVELSPNKESIGKSSSQHDFFSRSSEEHASSAVSVAVAGIVPLIELEAGDIAILR